MQSRFPKTSLLAAALLSLNACGGGENAQSLLQNDLSATVGVSVELPSRLLALDDGLIVQSSIGGQTGELGRTTNQTYSGSFELDYNVRYTIYVSVRRAADNLLLASGDREVWVASDNVAEHFPEQSISMSIDTDGDGFFNIDELEQQSDPLGRNGDYDNDGIPDTADADDDNDGVPDNQDALPYNSAEQFDTDGDSIGDNADPDDDNDGTDDRDDRFPRDPTETTDTDADGIGNNADSDDDNDGIPDAEDPFPLDAQSSFDTDNDGIPDNVDTDDDNDGVLDASDAFPLDPSESLDTDRDGIGNNADSDDDNDDTTDLADPQPLNDRVTGREDDDSDGYPNIDDAFPNDPTEYADTDGDGIGNNADPDDDGNGVPDNQDFAMAVIPRSDTTPLLDGIFGWSEWRNAVRCDTRGNPLAINHLLLDTQGDEQDLQRWPRSEWRAMHDGNRLYLLVRVINEPFFERHNDSTGAWQDDSLEIFIDAGNEGNTDYDGNDYQFVIRFAGAGLVGSNSASGLDVSWATSFTQDSTDATIATYELSIDLSSAGIDVASQIGFDVQVNDDDDGGDRDSKWAWWSPSGNDDAWRNPSLFGPAILAPGRVNID